MKEVNGKRMLAAKPFSFNAYEDNYGAVMALCEASGRIPAEELRDLLDEGIRARMNRNGDGVEVAAAGQQPERDGESARLVEALQQLVQKTNLNNDMMMRIALHLREQYGMVLEAVAAGYSARHLIWKYVVEGALRDEGLSPQQIMRRLEEDRRTWNAERDQAADVIEQGIRSIGLGRDNGSGST